VCAFLQCLFLSLFHSLTLSCSLALLLSRSLALLLSCSLALLLSCSFNNPLSCSLIHTSATTNYFFLLSMFNFLLLFFFYLPSHAFFSLFICIFPVIQLIQFKQWPTTYVRLKRQIFIKYFEKEVFFVNCF
jgi:hypothetical protein